MRFYLKNKQKVKSWHAPQPISTPGVLTNYSDVTFRLFPKDNGIKNKTQVVRQDKEDFKLEVSLGLF